jgi:hypothetical protein
MHRATEYRYTPINAKEHQIYASQIKILNEYDNIKINAHQGYEVHQDQPMNVL